ncbi:MAG: 3-dehydroquinate synthase [Candidatus Marinimicrobia bacterium]|jgi:3-dehydroquinate synthase|nr:3-dehydroquinate synthase [Candidatus Neomarinimicrobiota bacterium]
MLRLDIESGEKDYEVAIDGVDCLDFFIDEIKKEYRKVVFVVDERVKTLYPCVVNYEKYEVLELEATEKQKTFSNIDNVVDFYQRVNLQNKDVLVALGGGIIQDIVAFTSKVYHRGVDYYLIPTTLLSMSDSSIGAKCGINYNDKKNQLGVFNAPKGVFQNVNFIKTLKYDDVISGVGEIVKLLITGSREDFEYLKENILDCIDERKPFTTMIYKSLLAKKAVIEEDEYESDLRRILNYGHTFGHAVESLSDYKIAHGIAVLWGIDFVNYIALRRGFIEEGVYEEINNAILSIYDIGGIEIKDFDLFLEYVKNDKKVEGEEVNIVFPKQIGQLMIRKVKFDDQLLDDMKSYYL